MKQKLVLATASICLILSGCVTVKYDKSSADDDKVAMAYGDIYDVLGIRNALPNLSNEELKTIDFVNLEELCVDGEQTLYFVLDDETYSLECSVEDGEIFVTSGLAPVAELPTQFRDYNQASNGNEIKETMDTIIEKNALVKDKNEASNKDVETTVKKDLNKELADVAKDRVSDSKDLTKLFNDEKVSSKLAEVEKEAHPTVSKATTVVKNSVLKEAEKKRAEAEALAKAKEEELQKAQKEKAKAEALKKAQEEKAKAEAEAKAKAKAEAEAKAKAKSSQLSSCQSLANTNIWKAQIYKQSGKTYIEVAGSKKECNLCTSELKSYIETQRKNKNSTWEADMKNVAYGKKAFAEALGKVDWVDSMPKWKDASFSGKDMILKSKYDEDYTTITVYFGLSGKDTNVSMYVPAKYVYSIVMQGFRVK